MMPVTHLIAGRSGMAQDDKEVAHRILQSVPPNRRAEAVNLLTARAREAESKLPGPYYKDYMTNKIIYVEWVDSASVHGWVSLEEISPEPMVCRTVGFLVTENDKVLVLAGSTAASDSAAPFCDPITIPKVAITKRKGVTL